MNLNIPGCGKKQTKSGTEAQMMSLNELKTFILREAPDAVTAKFIQLKKKDRPSLCAILKMFPRGLKALGMSNSPKKTDTETVSVENFGFSANNFGMFEKPKRSPVVSRKVNTIEFGNRPANLNTVEPMKEKVTKYLKEKDPLARKNITNYNAAETKPMSLKSFKKVLKPTKPSKIRVKLLKFGGNNMRKPTSVTSSLVVLKGPSLSENDKKKVVERVNDLMKGRTNEAERNRLMRVETNKRLAAKKILINLANVKPKLVSSSAVSVMKNNGKISKKKASILQKLRKRRVTKVNLSKKPINYNSSPESVWSPGSQGSSQGSPGSVGSRGSSPGSPGSPVSPASPKKKNVFMLEGKAATSYKKDQLVRYVTLLFPKSKKNFSEMSKPELARVIEQGLKKK